MNRLRQNTASNGGSPARKPVDIRLPSRSVTAFRTASCTCHPPATRSQCRSRAARLAASRNDLSEYTPVRAAATARRLTSTPSTVAGTPASSRAAATLYGSSPVEHGTHSTRTGRRRAAIAPARWRNDSG